MKRNPKSTSKNTRPAPAISITPLGNPLNIDEDIFGLPKVEETNIPILPLRDNPMFPHSMMPIPLGRESSIKAAEYCQKHRTALFCVAQKDPETEAPTGKDLFDYGVLVSVLKIIQLPDDSVTALIHSFGPARLVKVSKRVPFLRGVVEPLSETFPEDNDREMAVMINTAFERFNALLDVIGEEETQPLRFELEQMPAGSMQRFDLMMTKAPMSVEQKVNLIAETDFKSRIELFVKFLEESRQLMLLRREIHERTTEELSQQQKEHYLQEQVRLIQDELGHTDDEDIQELRERAEGKQWSEAAAKHFEKELNKLYRYSPNIPDYAVQYNYIETLLNLPWDVCSTDNFSLAKVERILNRDHYGLDKVKERIVEQMAVIKLRNDLKAPIICLHGAPGVGKTSLGRSIADALGREYCRVSLGGLHDEAEIRGHRRTYIGAMPGRIISALAKCKTNNPVFVLDELDKVGQDFKGDPSTALLEVLDPEQNSKFHDNYLDFDYDLSKVLFIATANSLSTISRPLLDRMELIEIDGYITEEKVEIASRHLVKKSLREHGFDEDEIKFEKKALQLIVESYTRESGVRQLDKKIGKVLRKIARLKASDKLYPRTVTKDLVHKYLGAEEVTPDLCDEGGSVGVVTGLAWTQVGGEILFIESSLADGKGEKLTLTGNLGDVMKESAMLALQYLKANAGDLGIDPKLFSQKDVHIHVPEGAIPKDGPSAGVTMVTSLASSFTGRRVRPHIAMTGEITLRGRVLPVGGIREKILAAKRAGVRDIILCEKNRKDIDEIPARYLKGLEFHYVSTICEVLNLALEP